MTICIAAMCQFSYGSKDDGTPDVGPTVLLAADRMFTDTGLEIEYESGQGKWSAIGGRVVILVADSLPIQSDILSQLHKYFATGGDIDAREVADKYSELVIKYKRDEAERLYLAPYGMTMESFVKEIQSSTSSALITDLANSVLEHSIDVEAIVGGVTEQGVASIYHVNNRGQITSHSDVGFLSVGSGHYHANSFLTSHSYWNRWSFYQAIAAVYGAKRQAEHAPGVGKQTDIIHITRDGFFHMEAHLRAALDVEYPKYVQQLARMEARLVDRIWKRADKTRERANAVQAENVVTIKK